MTSGIDGSRPVALVTGGAKRVGAAICERLAARGLDVCVTYRSSEDAARSLAARLATSCVLEQVDLDDVEASESFARRMADELPRLDVLVHNASVYFPMSLGGFDARKAEMFMRVHAVSPLAITAALSAKLRGSALKHGGAVVCMADIHSMGRPRKDFVAYSMSKAAVVEMVRSLARDLAPGARVNGVAPGVVKWPDEGYESDEASQAAYLSRVPMERAGTPEDAADVVSWLALDAGYVNGAIVPLDGGRRLA